MAYVNIADCWFNLDLVELIETSTMPSENGEPTYTLFVYFTSGRQWIGSHLDRETLEKYAHQFELAV